MISPSPSRPFAFGAPISRRDPGCQSEWTPAPKYETDLHYRQDRRGFNRSGYTHLFVVPAEGGTARAVTSGEWNVGGRFDGQAGAVSWDWAPDGRTVYVVGMNDPRADANYRNSNIYSVDVATGATKRLNAQDGAWSGVAVSPDGRKIAFEGFPSTKASYQADEVYVMHAAFLALIACAVLRRWWIPHHFLGIDIRIVQNQAV